MEKMEQIHINFEIQNFLFFSKKADKRDLDNKVYRKTFEDACNEISNNINNLGQKSINFVRIYFFLYLVFFFL
jgi:hypothetical protein